MQMDPSSAARYTQGMFQNRHHGGAPSSHESLKHAKWGQRQPALRLTNNPVNLLTGALLLSSVLPARQHPGPVAIAPPVSSGTPAHAQATAALLPSAQAQPNDFYIPLATPRPPRADNVLQSVSNGATLVCGLSIRTCLNTAVVAAVASAVGTVAALAYFNTDGNTAQPDESRTSTEPDVPPQDHLLESGHEANGTAKDGGPVALESALLQIARDCDGDRQCRATQINALLQRLPPAEVAQLRQMTEKTVPASDTDMQSAWRRHRADAAAWSAGDGLLELADTLAGIYTPEVAMFQDDLERIVASTVSGGGGREETEADIQQRWIDANIRRQDTVATLLERDAGSITRLPYTLQGLRHLGIADGTTAFNLHVTLPMAGEQVPARRVLLVAHTDMIGRSLGSEGALDNASGVATLLHMARQMQADPSSPGTQVELLLTSYEELGFLGARAYVDSCLHQQDCPTFVINVDMTGRGQGYAMSGTDALAGSPHLGKPTMYLQAPAVTETEQQARQQLEQGLASHGFTRPSAEDTPWITSDNIAFQNASIPCVAISQMSAKDARLWKKIEDARKEWNRRDAQVDWNVWQAQKDGTAKLSPEEARVLKATYQAASSAYSAYRQLRDANPAALPVMIHSNRDRLHRVDPAMGVAFADALLSGVRTLRWEAPALLPTSTDPAS